MGTGLEIIEEARASKRELRDGWPALHVSEPRRGSEE